MFDQKAFNDFIVSNAVIGFFSNPLLLKSGRRSNWYVNWRPVVSDVWLLDRLSDFVIEFVNDLLAKKNLPVAPLCFYGVPEGATKLAVITQYKWAKHSANFSAHSHPLPMGRAKPKEHGSPSDRFFIGAPSGPTIVLEDVTTTGGSLIQTISTLTEAEIPVIAAIGLTNRMEKRDDGKTVAEAISALSSKGVSIPYFQLSDSLSLLPLAVSRFKPAIEIEKAIVDEFKQYGIKEIEFNK